MIFKNKGLEMQTELKEKFEKIVELVNYVMVDPDIDLTYCIPEVAITSDKCDVNGIPYILVKYNENNYVERKIRLTDSYLSNTPEEIANLVTFSIEQFKLEIDGTQLGG